MSNPENQTPALDPVAAAGATAQTSGFVAAGSSSEGSIAPATVAPTASKKSPTAPTASSFVAPTFPSSVSTGIFPTTGFMGSPFGGGGMVPIPVYTGGGGGGLQSSPNVPAPGASIDPSTGKPFSAGMTRAELDAKKAADLSGREQAARQLPGPGLSRGASEVSTPGRELPGGWGPVSPVPPPGTSPDAPASIYDDVNTVLQKVGQTAYSALPASLKDAISNSPDAAAKGKQKEGTPVSPSSRRSSVAVLFDNVKHQTVEIVQAIRDETHAAPPTETDPARRTTQNQPGIFSQVKGFFQDPYNEKPHGVTGAATLKTSLPSDEPLGARPGEHVSGVGALPGQANETGVAILPDEKASSASTSVQPNQSLLPGEVSAGVGDLPGSSSETAVAALPDVKAQEGSAGGFIAVPDTKTSDRAPDATSAGNSDLAPPLPQTQLGEGISEGATNPAIVTATGTDGEAAGSVLTSATSSTALTAPPANDRTDSMASITAIRHGHAGARDDTAPSPLAQGFTATEPSSTGSGSELTDHHTHGPTPTPVPVPAPVSPKHEHSAIADSPTTKSNDLPTTDKIENGHSHSHTQSPISPVAKSGVADEKNNRRGSSTSSNGKKKVGFMNKLKGEMKVISGKIGGDEAKVAAGERLKHGEQM